MLNSIKIPTYREVVFLSVEVLFPTALSFTHPFRQAGMHESQVKFRTISLREKIVYKNLIISN